MEATSTLIHSNPNPVDNRGPLLRVVTITLLVLAVTSFSMRTYVRVCMVKSFGLDDCLMTLATVAFVLYSSCVLAGVHYGTGRHLADLSDSDARQAEQFWFFCYLGYSWTMILSKLSIAIFLLRILTQRAYRWLLYAVMILSCITGLTFFFVTMLQCQPIYYFWDKRLGTAGTCVAIDVVIGLAYLYSALNILCDFTIALLPIAIVWDLGMSRRLKMATVPLLGMGCVASGAVAVRLAYLETLRDPDFLYATVGIALWSTMEGGLAITAGCLACTRPIFKALSRCLGSISSSKWSNPKGSRNQLGRKRYRITEESTRSQEENMSRPGGRAGYADGSGVDKAAFELTMTTTTTTTTTTEIGYPVDRSAWNGVKRDDAFSGARGSMAAASTRNWPL